MISHCCLSVCVSVYPPIVARQRLFKYSHIVAKQRLGSVKIPLSLLGNGTVKTFPR
jgi:hypothetical protein